MAQPNDILNLHERLKAEYQDRDVAIFENREYVLGKQWRQKDLEELPEGVKPVTVNYVYPVVLKNVTFQVGRPPQIVVPLAEDTPEARQYADFMEKALYGLHEANRMNRRYYDMAWNCSVAGGQPLLIDYDPVRRVANIGNPLPERCYPEFGRDDENLVPDRLVVEEFYSPFHLAQKTGRAESEFHTDQFIEGREFCKVLRYSDAHQHVWIMECDGTVIDRRMGYGFVPYSYLPNIPVAGGVDGLADVTMLKHLQKQLNTLFTMQRSVVETYADPPIIMEGTGVDPATVGWGPGLKLPINQGGKVYFLSWEGTPPDFRDQVQNLISAMQDLSGIPDVAFGRYEASIQSGIALNTQFQPTRLLMAIKQGSWTDAFNEVHRMSMKLMADKLGEKPVYLFGALGNASEPFTLPVRGVDLEGYTRSQFIWPGMLPKDDATEAQTLLNRLASGGISLYTYLEEMGHESPSEEIKRIREEKSDPVLHPENVQQPAAAPAGGDGGFGPSVLDQMGAAGMGGGDFSLPGMGGPSGAVPMGLGPQDANVSDEQGYAGRGL